MTTFLPKEVAEGLEAARKQALRKKSRLRVQAGTEIFTLLKYWDSGFSVDLQDAPQLRGLVDLYDGSRHLYQCLIVASEEEAGRCAMSSSATPVPLTARRWTLSGMPISLWP